jgi:hypothetical protein
MRAMATLRKLSGRVSPKLTLEIATERIFSSVSFGDTLPDNFRRVAIARIHQSLTQLSKLKVSLCDTCTQIRTVIAGSYLKIARGIADDDFRIKTAKSLDVNGFLDIAVFMTEDRQLSIALNAYEASNGEIVYSKIITGEPAQTQSEKYSIKEAKYEEEIKSLNTRLTDAEQRAEAAEKLVGELEKTIDELEDELFKTKLRTKSVQDEMDIAINEAATR